MERAALEETVARVRVRFSERLFELRTRAGLSQERLGALAGLTPEQIGRLENRRSEPKADTLLRLALALGVTIDDFYR